MFRELVYWDQWPECQLVVLFIGRSSRVFVGRQVFVWHQAVLGSKASQNAAAR